MQLTEINRLYSHFLCELSAGLQIIPTLLQTAHRLWSESRYASVVADCSVRQHKHLHNILCRLSGYWRKLKTK